MEGIYLVFTTPFPGQEDEYHQWYNSQHIPDILAVPGVEYARRYALREEEGAAKLPLFLAVYGFSDVPLAVSGITARRGTELLRTSATVNKAVTVSRIFDVGLAAASQYVKLPDFYFSLYRTSTEKPSPGMLIGIASAVQAGKNTAEFSAIHLGYSSEASKAIVRTKSDERAGCYVATAITECYRST